MRKKQNKIRISFICYIVVVRLHRPDSLHRTHTQTHTQNTLMHRFATFRLSLLLSICLLSMLVLLLLLSESWAKCGKEKESQPFVTWHIDARLLSIYAPNETQFGSSGILCIRNLMMAHDDNSESTMARWWWQCWQFKCGFRTFYRSLGAVAFSQ